MTGGRPEHPAQRLSALLAAARGVEIWVAGDIMVDEYLSGDVQRISPDAPVQVVGVRARTLKLGGASNVAHNIVALGPRVTLGGLIGRDEYADFVRQECARLGIDASSTVEVATRPTTTKTRVLARNQQILRLDRESTAPADATTTKTIAERFRASRSPKCIVISDYAKGTVVPELLKELSAEAKARGTFILVDPKHRDFGRYVGATVITPNLKELETATGIHIGTDDDALRRAATIAMDQAKAEALVVTLSERGLAVFERGKDPVSIAATARDVFDVTGAGDTVIATMAVFLAAGASLVEAASLANVAAGIVVGKVGTASVSSEELSRALAGERSERVLGRETLAGLASVWRQEGRKIVFTNGCFDILHVGHVQLLTDAAKHGDVLVVGLNSDASVARLKGPSRPVVHEADRAAVIAALDCVDAVSIFDEDTPEALISAVEPDILVKGGDYRLDQVVGRELVERRGGRVVLVPLLPDRSTTRIVEKLRGPGA